MLSTAKLNATGHRWVSELSDFRFTVNYVLSTAKLNSIGHRWVSELSDFRFTVNYVLSTAELNATGHRWVSELSDFRFTVNYRPGKVNIDADVLSRMPRTIEDMMQSCTSEVSLDILQETAAAMSIDNNDPLSWAMCLPTAVDTIDIDQHTANQYNSNLSTITPRDIIQAQQCDPVIAPVLRFKVQGA